MDTNGKVTKSQLDITNDSQEVSPFPAGDHKAAMNRCQIQDINNTNDPQKKYCFETVSKNILLEGLNGFHAANLTLSSDVASSNEVEKWQKP